MLQPEGHGQRDHVKIAGDFLNQGCSPFESNSGPELSYVQALFVFYIKTKNGLHKKITQIIP
jgi:hypothetical protein